MPVREIGFGSSSGPGGGGGIPVDGPGDAPGGLLNPESTVTATKSGSNPTLNVAGAMPFSVVKVGSTYYQVRNQIDVSLNNDVRLASAGTVSGTWTDLGSVLTLGSQGWEQANRANGAWLMEDGGTYYLFYGSNDGAGTPGIGVATSSNVTGPYTKYASNPILTPTTGTGAWDSRRVNEPSVIKVGSTWIMAFMAEDEDVPLTQSEKIGIATATDPFGPWTKDADNPVLGFGSGWDATGAFDPALFYYNGYYWMLYSGASGASGAEPWKLGLAYATSPTGTWTRFAGNPILDVGAAAAWDDAAVWRGSVWIEDDVLTLIYAGLATAGSYGSAKGGVASLAVT